MIIPSTIRIRIIITHTHKKTYLKHKSILRLTTSSVRTHTYICLYIHVGSDSHLNGPMIRNNEVIQLKNAKSAIVSSNKVHAGERCISALCHSWRYCTPWLLQLHLGEIAYLGPRFVDKCNPLFHSCWGNCDGFVCDCVLGL